ANFRGIDMVRDIQTRVSLAPISGPCRIWLIDECHKLSNDAMNAFLKLLEDTPKHCYFMLCTTDPGKLIAAIKTRCTEIAVKGLVHKAMEGLLLYVMKEEKLEFSQEVIDEIIGASDGSARKALVLLEQVMELDTDELRIEAIQNSDTKREAYEIFQALIR